MKLRLRGKRRVSERRLGDGDLVVLVGNPNSGKTTLFNGLTGLRQKVGNYAGVTVEKKEGTYYTRHGKRVRLLDLPGSYSLQARSPDERIATQALLGRLAGEPLPDGVICCVDGSNIERNLYMATQVIELGLPVIVVVTMLDIARRRGIRVDLDGLSERLGVGVVGVDGRGAEGLLGLKLAMSGEWKTGKAALTYPKVLSEGVEDVATLMMGGAGGRSLAMVRSEARLKLFAEEGAETLGIGDAEQTRVQLWRQRFDREVPGWRSELVTLRYSWLGEVVRAVVRRVDPRRRSITERVDKVVLHPVGGIGFLVCVLAVLFYSIFRLAVPLMDGVDALVGGIGGWVGGVMAAGALRDLLVEGVIGGVGAVMIFLPQILLLFFFIALLESTGYMARAAFILDRVMGKVGLHGRSFIPLLSSYACAVPGILAARTIESPKDRLVTIFVAPFMTCSARLPVYLVMIAALMPVGPGHAWAKALLLLGLYLLGTVTALLTALVLRRTILSGPSPSLVMELPTYRLPRMGSVVREMWDRGYAFLKRAGTLIFALSIVLWFAMSYPKVPEAAQPEVADAVQQVQAEPTAIERSYAGQFGRFVAPVFAPLGYDWQITVGVLASFAAREVFVSTMAIIYQVDEAAQDEGLLAALRSAQRADGTQLFTPLTCLSILIFFVYALQCVSTIAVVRRETCSWGWALFQFAYMFAFAWIAAFIVYQGGQLLGYQ